MIKNILLLTLTLPLSAAFVVGQNNPSSVVVKHQRSPNQAVKITFKPQPAYADQSTGSVCIQGMGDP